MAEFEEIGEVIDEAFDGISEEGADTDGLTREEIEELEAETAEAKESVSTLRKVVDYFKTLDIPQMLKKFSWFVAKNVAIAAVILGATAVLKKLMMKSSGTKKKDQKKKYDKIKAITKMITDLTDISKKVVGWVKDHEKDEVVIDGYSIPLPDIFTKYTTPMGEDLNQAYDAAKELMTKQGGKTRFSVPTTGQVVQIVNGCQGFVTSIDNFVKFADDQKKKFPALSTLPVSLADVDKLKSDLSAIKSLPYGN